MEHVSSAIASAVEEQSVTTREIARSVQAVTLAVDGTAHAMGEVVVSADQAGQVGQSVSVGADEISQQASNLRVEVDQFLHAIQTDAGERRDYERLDGNGIMVNVQLQGRPAKQIMLVNMSRSGIAVGFREQVPAGTDIEVTMPGDRTPLPGRVVRTAPDGVMAIVFRQDDATLERVDQVLATVRTSRAA